MNKQQWNDDEESKKNFIDALEITPHIVAAINNALQISEEDERLVTEFINANRRKYENELL